MLVTKKGYKYIADIVMPNTCAFCGKVIEWDRLLCSVCEDDMPEKFDGSVLIENTDGAFGCFYYENKIIDLIYRLKHGGAVYNFAELCADMISEKLINKGIADDIDLVTSVPMNLRKKIVRGHDQAEVLAKFVADKLGKPVERKLLYRSSDSTEQHKLERDERREHADKVYSLSAGHKDIKGKTILICDDVITTGSTVRACAAKLREAGADKIYACSAAVSSKYKEYSDKENIIP